MNYKDLADLIFPNAKDISYYEEKYPERNLPEGAIVTRFAPSPTGFVHIGGLYQALVAKLSANKTHGVFFLRVEDTDQKREQDRSTGGNRSCSLKCRRDKGEACPRRNKSRDRQ